jgi:hypothetical protein
MIPTQIKHFQVNRAAKEDAMWLMHVLKRGGKGLGTSVELNQDNTLTLQWAQ